MSSRRLGKRSDCAYDDQLPLSYTRGVVAVDAACSVLATSVCVYDYVTHACVCVFFISMKRNKMFGNAPGPPVRYRCRDGRGDED